MGRGSPMWGVMRSMRRDQSVMNAKVARGTGRRIPRFGSPYRKVLTTLLVLVVIDAVIGAVNPLLLREIINQGIVKHNAGLIVTVAVIVAGLAIADAVLSLGQRYVSARIGEGLIFDMRTKVFAHIQKMPLAFFTRTEAGALVPRLNNDVLGAQEAFTDILGTVVSNLIGVALVLVAMFILSWQLTLVSLILLPVFVMPARWLGRRLQGITREAYALNAQMNTTMTERVNVAGALLVKLFGRPSEEAGSSYPNADEVSLASLEWVATLARARNEPVLFDVSFTVEPGEMVALVGPSGAGKTTLCHLVPRLYDVRSGAVRIDGIDVRDATLDSLRDSIGMVTQDAHMFHESIRSNLLYAKPDASDHDLHEALRGAQILPLVESLPDGVDTLVGDPGYPLSRGAQHPPPTPPSPPHAPPTVA